MSRRQPTPLTSRPFLRWLTVIGYGLIVVAGAVMLIQSLRPSHTAHDGAGALIAGIGLLPCPLTISVLGFAWAQGTSAMVGLVLLSLALGIAATIGIVAILAITARATLGTTLGHRLPQLNRGAHLLQGVAAVAIIAIGFYTTLLRV